MIITFNGDHGSGKSTVAKRVAKELGYEYYYTGKIFRDLAEEKGVTYAQFLDLLDKDPSVDREVDQRTTEMGETKDNTIFDSRMAWHFIPKSLKIFLKADEDVAAERMFLHLKEESSKDRKNEGSNIATMEDIKKANLERKKRDDKRYKELYNVDIWDEGNYDFVLNTSNIDRDGVFKEVMKFVKGKLAEEKE